MKKIFILLVTLLVTLNYQGLSSFSYASAPPPELVGETAILIDAATGEILYEKNMHEQRYPASTTKIMTALLTLENLDLSKTVTIDAETPFTEGSRIYLLEGEQVTVEQLLYALLLESANDAGVALAKEIAGSVPEFAKMMNERAKQMGALHTNFTNPHGLQDPAHVSTAYDLAMITKGAMKNKTLRELVTTYRYIIPETNRQETRYLYNTNRLLYDQKTKVYANGVLRAAKYEDTTGIKTGYTSHAGGCLIAGAKRGDTEFISVVLKSTDAGRFGDSIALLDYGFANYKSARAIDAGTALGDIAVSRGAEKRVGVVAAQTAFATLPIEASTEVIRTNVVLDKKVEAPVIPGQKVGVVEIYEGENLVAEIDAVAEREIVKGGILSLVGIPDETAGKIQKLVLSFVGIVLFLLILYILIKRRQVKMRRRRRLERAMRNLDR